MNVYFPTAFAITLDADEIIEAINGRTQEIKANIDSQGVLKKIVLEAAKVLGLASGVFAVAALATSLVTFTITPLTFAFAATAAAVTWFTVSILLDPRNAGEAIVKDQWQALFQSLREDSGEDIIKRGQDLLKQKEQRPASFDQCVGKLDPETLNPFFHKTCMVGYLLIALKHLHQKEEELAKSNAHLAMSHFGSSGFPKEIEQLAQAIIANPAELVQLIENHQVGNGIHALDYLINLKTKNNEQLLLNK